MAEVSHRLAQPWCCPLWGKTGLHGCSVPGLALLTGSRFSSPPQPPEGRQESRHYQPPGKGSTGMIKKQLMCALLELWWHCSFQSHSLSLAPLLPASLCGFSFISCFSFPLQLVVRAGVEVQIMLQLRSALLEG